MRRQCVKNPKKSEFVLVEEIPDARFRHDYLLELGPRESGCAVLIGIVPLTGPPGAGLVVGPAGRSRVRSARFMSGDSAPGRVPSQAGCSV